MRALTAAAVSTALDPGIDGHDARGRLVVAGRNGVGLLAQLDAGDVTEAHDGAVGVGADDDGAKLLGLYQAALCPHGVSKLLALRDRLSTDLAGGVYVVLGLDSLDDVRRGDAQLGHLVGVHPNAHGVLSAEYLHARDAFDAGELVLQVDDGIVGEELLAQFAAGRVDGDEHQRRGERLLHGQAGGGDLGRQL
jgi:hypothetical protein